MAHTDYKTFSLENLGVKQDKKEKPGLQDKRDKSEEKFLIEKAIGYYESLLDVRERAWKNFKYAIGNQWFETIVDPDSGATLTEEKFITNSGRVPLKQNVIRMAMKSIKGHYRTNMPKSIAVPRSKSDEATSNKFNVLLDYVHDINESQELELQQLEYYMLSGLPIGKANYKFNEDEDRDEIEEGIVNLNRAFLNTDISDIRGKDLNFIGEFHDMKLGNVISEFAKTEGDEKLIRQWYSGINEKDSNYEEQSYTQLENIDPYVANENMCRVIEIWYKKMKWRTRYRDYMSGKQGYTDYSLDEIKQINEQRIIEAIDQGVDPNSVALIQARRKKDQIWAVKYLTPRGDILFQADDPYKGIHPYFMIAYPFINGRIAGFIEDVIDQQRSINRTISQLGAIRDAAAKGVLLYDKNTLGGMDPSELAKKWSRTNSTIGLDLKPGQEYPKQIHTQNTSPGDYEFLKLQLDLFQRIYGGSEASRGEKPPSGTPASLYAQWAQNSLVNMRDLFDYFNLFKKARDLKILHLINVFYDDPVFINVLDTHQNIKENYIDPTELKNIRCDITIGQTLNTPVFNQIMDETLRYLYERNAIDTKIFLKHSNLPGSDVILQDIVEREGEIQQQMARQLQQAQEQPQNIPQ